MQRSDFNYELPEQLIASEPLDKRSDSRMLCLCPGGAPVQDGYVRDLPGLLHAGDLLVFNNTRVIPARLFGRKHSGGKVEILIERITGERSALALVRSGKPPRTGMEIELEGGGSAVVTGRSADLFRLEFRVDRDLIAYLELAGHVPLPPYIKRPDRTADRERYQTVYARLPGAVAAPTAGLHFDRELLEQIRQRGIETAFLTLHVGAGTFQPVRTENLSDHVMHTEHYEIDAEAGRKIADTRSRGGRIVAVGTTVVRTLETVARDGDIRPARGETGLFIIPGYRFRCVDALLTNFPLPESMLMMLVCAFGGYENVMAAYRHAIREGYRFYSYGDAMFINRDRNAPECRRDNALSG